MRPGVSSVAITTNQRPDRRSNRTRGPNGDDDPRSDAKNVFVVMLRTPSATPDERSSVLIRPLAATTNCVGPIAPVASGGISDSVSVAAGNDSPVTRDAVTPAVAKTDAAVCCAAACAAGRGARRRPRGIVWTAVTSITPDQSDNVRVDTRTAATGRSRS